jgi:hypothetical protein
MHHISCGEKVLPFRRSMGDCVFYAQNFALFFPEFTGKPEVE